MEKSQYTSEKFGKVVKTPGEFGFWTFLPAKIPRSIELDKKTISMLSEADRALGRLEGAGRLLPSPQILVNAYIKREALASARIEGTQATLSELYEAESEGTLPGDVDEVVNYISALNLGISRNELAISSRLLKELHKVLLDDVRGKEKQPGNLRDSPNWIASPDNTPSTALFVPPPVDEMKIGLSDWEKFVNQDLSEMPPLIKCALMHYQFETLHPFLDGNGRLGRLLIVLFLIRHDVLSSPLLYLSAYFEEHKDKYYDALQGVREGGAIEIWLQLFLQAVATQAKDAEWRAKRLIDLREGYRIKLKKASPSAIAVVDLLMINPFVNTTSAKKHIGLGNEGTKAVLRRLEEFEILSPLPPQPGKANRWFAREIFDVIAGEVGPEG